MLYSARTQVSRCKWFLLVQLAVLFNWVTGMSTNAGGEMPFSCVHSGHAGALSLASIRLSGPQERVAGSWLEGFNAAADAAMAPPQPVASAHPLSSQGASIQSSALTCTPGRQPGWIGSQIGQAPALQPSIPCAATHSYDP